MNEMYNMSIVAHNFSVLVVLMVISINFYKIYRADGVQAYRKFNMLFNPIGATILGSVIFTGIIMMAAKHLDFSIANIIMIIFATVLVVLEAKRSKALRFIMNDDLKNFLEYKKYSQKILLSEFVITLVIYIGMLV